MSMAYAMNSNNDALRHLTAELRQRFGAKALQRGGQAITRRATPLASGYPPLDNLLDGGFPRGRLSELLSSGTAGGTSVVLGVMAQAQQQREQVAYLYLTRALDYPYVERCGVSLEHLLVVQPHSGEDLLAITEILIKEEAAGVLVVSSTNDLAAALSPRIFDSGMRRIANALHDSPCVLLFLSFLPGLTVQGSMPQGSEATRTRLAPHAHTRLHFGGAQGERWLRRKRQIVGFRVSVTVLKGDVRAGRQTTLTISLLANAPLSNSPIVNSP